MTKVQLRLTAFILTASLFFSSCEKEEKQAIYKFLRFCSMRRIGILYS